jgi:hypothetical protein
VARACLTSHISWEGDSQGCIHSRIDKNSYIIAFVSPVLRVCFALIQGSAKLSNVQYQPITPNCSRCIQLPRSCKFAVTHHEFDT